MFNTLPPKVQMLTGRRSSEYGVSYKYYIVILLKMFYIISAAVPNIELNYLIEFPTTVVRVAGRRAAVLRGAVTS